MAAEIRQPLRRGTALIAAVALAALAPAPIRDTKNRVPVPERSQAQLAAEMRFNGAFKPVGTVRMKESPAVDLRETPKAAVQNSASAGARFENPDAAPIVAATARVAAEADHRPFPAWLLALLLAGGAFGVVKGFRVWVDRTIPTGPR